LQCFNQAIILNPKNHIGWYNKGNLLRELKNYEEALQVYDQALTLKPEHQDTLLNKGNVYKDLNQYDMALMYYDQALKSDKNYARAYINKGVVYQEQGFFSQAFVQFDIALKLEPDFPEAQNNRSLLNLYLQKYPQGWLDYESRLKIDGKFSYPFDPNFLPIWSGQQCQRLLIIEEQGIGDKIFHASMLQRVCKIIPNVTVLIDKRLISIMRRSFPCIHFPDHGSTLDQRHFDAQIAFGSLMSVLRVNPTSELIGPFLTDNHELTTEIKKSSYFKNKSICGLAWKSSEKSNKKNIDLKDLEPILESSDHHFINLQYGDIDEDLSRLNSISRKKLGLYDGIDLFNNIEGLFSLVAACDMVITTSNVTAHVAGSLGKKCYLMVPYSRARIWYWHQEQISTWYPSIRIFSQDSSLGWTSAIDSISSLLKTEILN
jgi:regulator of sirC expression with transglutaminase-like and TPR domain